MSTVAHAYMKSTTLSLEVRGALSSVGKPTYAGAVNVSCRALREDSVARLNNGSEIKTFMTVWVASDQTSFPNVDDRVTVLGLVGIVVDRQDAKALNGTLNHVRLKLREQ